MRVHLSEVARSILTLGVCSLAFACGDAKPPERARVMPPSPAVVDTDARVVRIPGATIPIGTRPGTANRNAVTDADMIPTAIPDVEIDIGLYPNRGNEPPRVNVGRDEAARLCASSGKRLCHELEWERVCRANEPALRQMGASIGEWTSGPATRFEDTGAGIVRGAPSADRCGGRRAAPSSTTATEVGFRCCGGEAPSLTYPTEETHEPFVDRPMTAEAAREALARIPELSAYAPTFSQFTESDVAQVFVRGAVTPEAAGVRRPVHGVLHFTPRPFDETIVLAGRSGQTSLVAVLYPMGNGYVHGASMVLENDPVSVLVTYAASNTTAAQWTSCFDCAGEGGTIELRPDGRVVIVQR